MSYRLPFLTVDDEFVAHVEWTPRPTLDVAYGILRGFEDDEYYNRDGIQIRLYHADAEYLMAMIREEFNSCVDIIVNTSVGENHDAASIKQKIRIFAEMSEQTFDACYAQWYEAAGRPVIVDGSVEESE